MQIPLGNLVQKTVVLASGGTKTPEIDLGGFSLVGIFFPATFTGTALTFEAASATAGTFRAVKSGAGGSALSYTVAQATYAAIDPKDFAGIQFLKLVSGSTEGADRSLILVLKGV
jgi:hypothetical protein